MLRRSTVIRPVIHRVGDVAVGLGAGARAATLLAALLLACGLPGLVGSAAAQERSPEAVRAAADAGTAAGADAGTAAGAGARAGADAGTEADAGAAVGGTGSAAEAAPGVGEGTPDLTPLAGGEDPGGAPAAGAAGGRGSLLSTWDFVRMVLVLAAVVAAIYLILLFIRRSTAGRVRENDLITLLGSRALGGGRNLHLVQVGTGYYLVGAADEAVNLIAQITDQESIDTLKLELSTATVAGRRSFSDVLGEVLGGSGGGRGRSQGALLASGEAAAGSVLGRQHRRFQHVHRRSPHGTGDASG